MKLFPSIIFKMLLVSYFMNLNFKDCIGVFQVCYICEENGRATRSNSGACMQCNRNGCKMNFHVTW